MQRLHLIPRKTLLLLLAAYLGLNCLTVLVLFPSGLLTVFAKPTNGFISSTLLANATILLLLCGILGWATELRTEDIGLQRSGLAVGVMVTLALWLAVNALEFTLFLLSQTPSVALRELPALTNGMKAIAPLIGQLFGNAALEEVLFRGLLFSQVQGHLLASTKLSPKQAMVLALLLSQAVFAAIHLPLLVSSGVAMGSLPGELALLFFLGVLLALLHWRTGNLYVVIGVHAISNAPTLMVPQQFDLSTHGTIAAVGSIIAIAFWPNIGRRQSPWLRTTARSEAQCGRDSQRR